mmetsp:Transcript_111361/g.228053  ORF Transcript_111361/g.228053 Transcript_111361/m.228053 type:complete len:101 (+) Transcript_111361:195-497(+)
MLPASLKDTSIRSANLPGSTTPGTNNGGPEFQPPMPQTETQQTTSLSTSSTNFREQGTSMRNQIAPPISAPLARASTPMGQVDIGVPSEELIGRLDQVLN